MVAESRFEVRFDLEAKLEYQQLDTSTRRLVNSRLEELERRADQIGKPLANLQSSKLHGCRELKLRRAGIGTPDTTAQLAGIQEGLTGSRLAFPPGAHPQPLAAGNLGDAAPSPLVVGASDSARPPFFQVRPHAMQRGAG